jgi:GDP-D-mannose 3',5'-epimerase
MRELANRIIEVSGKEIKLKYDETKPVGVRSRVPILRKASEELNWKPTISLEDGLKKTYEWMKYDIARS